MPAHRAQGRRAHVRHRRPELFERSLDATETGGNSRSGMSRAGGGAQALSLLSSEHALS
jgi:hypothetical protein